MRASDAGWRLLTPQRWLVFSIASPVVVFGCLDSKFFNLGRDARAWGRRPALLGSLVLSFATTLLVFRNLREFDTIGWAFRSAGQWVSLLLSSGLVAVPFLPDTRHQPLPE